MPVLPFEIGSNSTNKTDSSAAYKTNIELPTTIGKGVISSRQKNVIESYVQRLGDYDWKENYSYDVWDDEDAARQERGDIPLYLYKRYDLDDPIDEYLYLNNLPPKKDIEKMAEKAEEEKETQQEQQAEEKYESWRNPIDTSIDNNTVEQIFKNAFNTTDTAQAQKPETTEDINVFQRVGDIINTAAQQNVGISNMRKRIAFENQYPETLSEEQLSNIAQSLYNTGKYESIGDARIAAEKEYNDFRNQGWLEVVGAPKDSEGNFIARSQYEYEPIAIANEMEQVAKNDPQFQSLNEALDTSEYDSYIRGELAELSPEALAAHDAAQQIEAYKKSAGESGDYAFVTDDEWAVYAYYYKTQGVDRANEYLASIYNRATDRRSAERSKNFSGGLIDSVLLSLESGIESSVKGLSRLFSDGYIERSEPSSVKTFQNVREETEGIAAFVSDALYSIGNMTPGLIIGAITGGGAVGAALLGASSAGNTYTETRKEGATEEQAKTLAILTGFSEGALQYVLGGIGKIGSKALPKGATKAVTNVISRVIKSPRALSALNKIIAKTSDMGSEALEEYLQSILEPQFRNLALNEENQIDLLDEEALYSALLGAFTSLAIGGSPETTNNAAGAQSTTDTQQQPLQTIESQPVLQQETRPGVGDTVVTPSGDVGVVERVANDEIVGPVYELRTNDGRQLAETSENIQPITAQTEQVEQQQTQTPPRTMQTMIGDEVRLSDGRYGTIENINSDPVLGEVYDVYTDNGIESVNESRIAENITAQEVAQNTSDLEQANSAQETGLENVPGVFDDAKRKADKAFEGRVSEVASGIPRKSSKTGMTWDDVAPRIKEKSGSQWRDVARVLDDAAGGDRNVRDYLYEQIEQPHNEAKAAYVRNTEHMTREMKNAYDSFGIKANSPESAAVFAYTQGYRMDENGNRVAYGYNDLVRDFPKNYQNIIEASAWTREFLDQYHELINDSRIEIYENAEANAQAELENLRGMEIFYQDAINKATADLEAAQTDQARSEAQYRLSELQSISESIRANRKQLEENIASGYYGNKRLAYRQNYMPHYYESPSVWSRTLNAFIGDEIKIDPDIVGKTGETSPKSQWSGRFLHQNNGTYVEDAVYSLTRYIEEGERLMAFDPVIARMNDPVNGVIQRIRNGVGDQTNANKFIAWAENWTNTLAGKTSGIDRGVLNLTGNPENRKWIERVRAINGLVRSSTLLGNARSALVQIGNIPNAMNYVPNPIDWAGGMYRMASRIAEDVGFKSEIIMKNALDESNFMAGRTHDYVMRSMDDFTSTPSKLASWMLEIGDRGSSELIWWSAMNQYERLNGNVKGTRTYSSAVDYADDITRRSVAGRERGDRPVNQASEIINLVDPFKLETVNQLNTMRETIKNKRFGGLAASLIGTFLLNELFQEIFGDTPLGLDFVRVFVDTVKAWDDEDDEDVQNIGDALERIFWRSTGELVSSMPLGAQALMFATSEDNLEALFGESDPTRYGTGNMGVSAVLDPILSYFTGDTIDPISSISSFVPMGKQLNRFAETAEIQGLIPDIKLDRESGLYTRQAETPTSYTSSGNVRYAADTDPLNIIKSLLFGQYATDAGKAYIESGLQSLNTKESGVYNDLAETGMNGNDIIDILNTLNTFLPIKNDEGKTETTAADQKRQYILDENGLTTDQQLLFLSSFDDKIMDEADEANGLGISNEQFLDYEYEILRVDQYMDETDDDEDAPSASELIKEYLKAQGFTERQAAYLYELHNGRKWGGW